MFDPGDAITDPDWRACIKAIIRVEHHVMTRSAKTGLWDRATHIACYLSNEPVSATQAADTIRAHWTIENSSHYSRDVTLREDASRIRSNPTVFARLRSFAYNILKANQTATMPQDRYRAALSGIKPLLKTVCRTQR